MTMIPKTLAQNSGSIRKSIRYSTSAFSKATSTRPTTTSATAMARPSYRLIVISCLLVRVGRLQETNGTTELVVFGGRGASGGRSMREPDRADPRLTGRGSDLGRRGDRGAARPIVLDALARGRPLRGRRALVVRLTA